MGRNDSKSHSSESGPNRWQLLAIIGVLALVSSIAIWYRWSGVPENGVGVPEKRLDETHVTPRGAPAHIRAIEAEKQKIGQESLEEMIDMLFRDDQIYFNPGMITDIIGQQRDLHACLSSRRVLRLCHEVGRLPDPQRSRLLNDLAQRSYDTVRETAEKIVRMDTHPGSPKNHQSMLANKMAVVAYCWMAAHYQSVDEVLKMLERFESYHAELKARVVNDDRVERSTWGVVNDWTVPDNACQLNLLMVALEHDARVARKRLQGLRERLRELPQKKLQIAAWDADTTAFDWPHALEGVPVDTSKGVAEYQVYDWGRHKFDEEFQQGILDEVKRFAAGLSSTRPSGALQ